MVAPTPTSATGRLNAPNREAWLGAAVEILRPTMAKIGELPKLRVACGFPSPGGLARRRRTVGQCWSPKFSADGTVEIFVSPTLADGLEVLDTLIHELLHAVVGTEHGHKGPFKRAMRRVGLVGRPTATRLGDELPTLIRGRILPDLGSYPHASLTPILAEKIQSSRGIKAMCEGCGYTVRLTRKWIAIGPPLCPDPNCFCRGEPLVVEWRGL